MNYLEVSHESDHKAKTQKYQLKSLSYSVFLQKLEQSFSQFLPSQIYYIDAEKEEVLLGNQDQFQYIKNQMPIDKGIVKVILKNSGKKSKETVMMYKGQEIKYKFTQKTTLSDLYRFYSKMLKKNHFELKYLEDGDYEILSKTDVKDWNRLKKGMELINLDYEFERVPEEKVIILKTGQSRTEQLRIMPETSFEDIQDIIYDKFNKKKVYMEYYNEKEEEKERIESEGDWEEFKKCCYNLDEMKIYDDVNQQQQKPIDVEFVLQRKILKYSINKEQPFSHFCQQFVKKHIKKGKYSLTYHQNQIQYTILDNLEWEQFKYIIFEKEVKLLQVKSGQGTLMKNRRHSIQSLSEKNQSVSHMNDKSLSFQIIEKQEQDSDEEVQEKCENLKKENHNLVKSKKNENNSDIVRKKEISNESDQELIYVPKVERIINKQDCPTCEKPRKQLCCYYCKGCNKYSPKDPQEQLKEVDPQIISKIKNFVMSNGGNNESLFFNVIENLALKK